MENSFSEKKKLTDYKLIWGGKLADHLHDHLFPLFQLVFARKFIVFIVDANKTKLKRPQWSNVFLPITSTN